MGYNWYKRPDQAAQRVLLTKNDFFWTKQRKQNNKRFLEKKIE